MSELEAILKKVWGYDSFRPLQKDIMESILAGRDTVAMLPTGAGKSLTYQLPAIAQDGISIVVTPLLSLMYDQVETLRSKGVVAACVNSLLKYNDIDRILDNCVYGDVKILYIAPERISTPIFQARVRKMNVNLIAVDEAHCISQWGYDFRPSYMNIGLLREALPNVPILALTATATTKVVNDITASLSLNSPAIFKSTFKRENISLVVREVDDKLEHLAHIITSLPKSYTGIVYCRTRKATVMVTNYLVINGISADFYHAGLDSKLRNLKQNDWMVGKTKVIVATSAFGMGIDKPDVRYVIHYQMPDTIEEYYQQAGRAGRDGRKSYAVVLYNSTDVTAVNRRADNDYPPVETIKNVYDGLCRFLDIPYEYGEDVTKIFPLEEFSIRYRFYPTTILASLRILHNNGYLTFIDEHESPTRIQFIIPRDNLYDYKYVGEQDEELIKLLLRSYTGLFTQSTKISEDYLAAEMGCTVQEIVAILIRLSKLKIIRYIPRNVNKMIHFEMNRVVKDDIYINPKTYIVRKNNLRLMSEFVADYLTQGMQCRMQMLCEYFDEYDSKKCCHCDVCRSNSTDSDAEPHSVDSADNEIIRILSNGGVEVTSVEDLCTMLRFPKHQILLSLRRLLWNGSVYQMHDGHFNFFSK